MIFVVDLSHTVAGEEVIVGDSEEVIHTDGVTPSSMKDILMPAPVSSTTALMSTTDMSEHAYSSMSKSQQPGQLTGLYNNLWRYLWLCD